MGKLTKQQSDYLGNTFLTYLEENDLKKTTSKPELRDIYLTFRRTQVIKTSYSQVLFHMSRRQGKIHVKNGHVYFRGTQDWLSSSRISYQIPKYSKGANHRVEIFNLLHSSQTRDALLKGGQSIAEVTSYPVEIGVQFGYFTFDVGDSDSNQFQMVVKNISDESLTLTKCLFLRDSDVMELCDDEGCTKLPEPKPVVLIPKSYYSISVICTLKKDVGSYCSDVFFCFQTPTDTFMTMRYLRCKKSDEITRFLQPTTPYTKPVFASLVFFSLTDPGEKVKLASGSNQLKFVRALPQYSIDSKLQAALKGNAFKLEDEEFINSPRNQDEEKFQNILKEDLDLSNYSKKFSCLLQLEEIQSNRDIHAYDMKEVEVVLDRNHYWLKVPGLAERRPSVLRGDKIYLKTESYPVRYEGYVHIVERDRVGLRFGTGFQRIYTGKMKFDVSFTFSRLPIRLMHRAVMGVGTKHYEQLLFPASAGDHSTGPNLRMYDSNLDNNDQQKKAVHAIFYGKSQCPYIIYGPPGTGKTVTMVEAIKQIVNHRREARVLICAPSNSACDLMVERLLANADKSWVFRMCALSRPWQDVPEQIRSVTNRMGDEYYYPSKEELMEKRVIATTLITAGRISSASFPSGHFDYVFVDEAGHAVEPEFMIAIENILGPEGRVVMAGDPKQLGPIVRSKVAVDFGYGKSYMERLMEDFEIYLPDNEDGYDARVITKLLKNYRSHEDILKIPNESFYDDELLVCANKMMRDSLCTWEKLPKQGFPVIFHGVKGEDMREGNSPSYFNPQEASKVYDYISDLLSTRHNPVRPAEIGVISPYRQQVKKIRQVLEKKQVLGREKIKVGSVEEFQGQERKVIIISTVRSDCHNLVHDKRFHLGFLQNPKRFNVAITRAKALLIVIGNPSILCKDHYWRKLLDFCRDRGGLSGIFYSLEDIEDEGSTGGNSDDESSDEDDDVDALSRRMEAIGLSRASLEKVSTLQKQVVPEWRNEM
uniref:RNA helicase n=1 Tax=Phallusia mammillata TaxID=59560 RepID=A0A6F9DLS1_9ASCI|nr:putative helicase mov-10-B.1 [Phallusia mammillata]